MQTPLGTSSLSVPDGRSFVSPFGPKRVLGVRFVRPVMGWVTFATLLVVIVAGFSFMSRNGDGSGRELGTSMGAIALTASPESTALNPGACSSDDPYFGCGQRARLINQGFIFYPNLDSASLEATMVQLQGWKLEPGATLPAGNGTTDAKGAVVDLVVSGVYAATFDVPVVVTRGAITINPNVEYQAGDLLELGAGDTVSYQLGGLVELHNPLATQKTEFKRAVIYDGDIASFSAVSVGVTTVAEGDATLAVALGAVTPAPAREVVVTLWYTQLINESPFPPARWVDATSIGPVDPQDGTAATEGFFLVIRQAQG